MRGVTLPFTDPRYDMTDPTVSVDTVLTLQPRELRKAHGQYK
jgi:hypothetical protein